MSDIFGAGDGDYQITCKTDALAPEIQIGDRLIVRPAKTAEIGQVVVVLIEGDEPTMTVARWSQETEGHVVGLVIGLIRSVA